MSSIKERVSELANDNCVQKGFLVFIGLLVVVYLFKWMTGRSEQFESGKQVVLESKQEEIPIAPPFVDNDVRTLMSGSGFIPQHDVIPPWGMDVDVNKYGIVDGLDDGAGGSMGLNYNLCSKSCCSEQWPTPFKLPYDKFVCSNKDNLIPNNYMCNNQWQDSGCVCMSKEQGNFISSRGNNA